jgi:uncharacterized repeat protein (TIGR03803 family)
MTPAGGFTNLADLDESTCGSPSALVQTKDGQFYGVSAGGGSKGAGAFFRLSTDGTLTSLLSFDTPVTGGWPTGLMLGSDGYFYGTTMYSTNRWGGVFRVSTNGVLTCLASLADAISGGGLGLVAEINGNFYGVFPGMGIGGTFFMVSPQGEATILYSFDRYHGTGGADPSSMCLGTDGNFYGTTTSHEGTFFRMTPDGVLTTLFQFDTVVGTGPRLAGRDADGGFYGVTSSYGAYGHGTFFKITTNGVPTILRAFGGADGLPELQGLGLGNDGILYGTFYSGATFDGAIFRLIQAPTLTRMTRQLGGMSLTGAGPANQPMRLWSASAVTLPPAQWTLRASSSFDAQGTFNFIDAGATTDRSRFYRISLP